MVHRRGHLSQLYFSASLAPRIPMSRMWFQKVALGYFAGLSALPGMSEGNLNHSRNRVRANSHALEDLVLGDVAHYQPETRGQCPRSSACPWIGQLPDSVDLATQVEACHGSTGSGTPSWPCKHLDYYLDEYTFRFNRRTSGSRGMLFYRLMEQAVMTVSLPYRQIVDGNHKM